MKRKIAVALMAALALTLLLSGMGQAFVLEGDNLKVGVGVSGGLVDITVPQGITLQATTSGPAFNVDSASLIFTQTIVFDKTFNHMHVSMDILNNSLVDITGLVVSRGIDPDQDVLVFGDFRTINTINADGSVTAVGPKSGLFVTLRSLTPDITGVASISGPAGGPWATDPNILGAGGFVNGGVAGYVDDSINMTWFIGDLAHGVSKEIDFEYEFGVVPVPPSAILLGSGLLGLVGFRFRRNRA